MKIDVQPEVVKWLPWAKAKLNQLTKLRIDLKLPKMVKAFTPSSGVLVFLRSDEFGDYIKISGGDFAYVATDPYHPIWGIQSALMPGTRAGVVPSITWTHTVQHTQATYMNADGSYTRNHALVICRYTRRVAEYTWTETRTLVRIDPATPGGIGFPPSPPTPETYVYSTVGAYVSHHADGESVNLRDTDEDGNVTNYVVTISPSLKVLSDADDWGWIDEGLSSLHPGVEPSLWTGPTFVGHNGTKIGYLRDATTFTQAGEAIYSGVGYPFSYNRVSPAGTTSLTVDITGGPAFNGTPSVGNNGYWNVVTLGAPWGNHPTDGLPIYELGTGAVIYALVNANASSGPSSLGALPITYAGATAASNNYLTSLNTTAGLEITAWKDACVTCAKNILTNVTTMMNDKVFGAASDLTELRPWESGTDHTLLKQVMMVQTLGRADYTLSLSGASDQTFQYNSFVNTALFPATIYGVSKSLVTAAPTNPFLTTMDTMYNYKYTHGTKSFSRNGSSPVAKVNFSRSSVRPPVLGSTVSLGYRGLYMYNLDEALAVAEQATLVPADGDIDALMRKACVGDLSSTELGIVAFQSVKGTAGAAYRTTPHTHTNGAYSFTQPVV